MSKSAGAVNPASSLIFRPARRIRSLPEKTDEKSEAYKAGYKNICEIGKERIRRAGRKIKEEAENNIIVFGIQLA